MAPDAEARLDSHIARIMQQPDGSVHRAAADGVADDILQMVHTALYARADIPRNPNAPKGCAHFKSEQVGPLKAALALLGTHEDGVEYLDFNTGDDDTPPSAGPNVTLAGTDNPPANTSPMAANNSHTAEASAVDEFLKSHDIERLHVEILVYLSGQNLAQTETATAVGVSKVESTVRPYLKALKQWGLVRPPAGKTRKYLATNLGKAVAHKVSPELTRIP